MNEYISREAVLNLIEHNDKVCHYKDERYENVVYATTQTICKVVAEMPAADVQPVKQWVKLHDKHPDTEGLYLVCDQYGECEVVEYLPDIKSWFTHKINGEIRYWMPLPKPPKDGDTE